MPTFLDAHSKHGVCYPGSASRTYWSHVHEVSFVFSLDSYSVAVRPLSKITKLPSVI